MVKWALKAKQSSEKLKRKKLNLGKNKMEIKKKNGFHMANVNVVNVWYFAPTAM